MNVKETKTKTEHLMQGVKEIHLGFENLSVAVYFAQSDTQARYRRSILGPFWIVLSTAISVVGLGYLWSLLFKIEPSELVPSLTIGLVIWYFLSGCILEAPMIFPRNSHFVKNMDVSYVLFLLTMINRQLINFAHNFIVILVILFIYPPKLGLEQLLIIPGLFLVLGNLFWISLLLALYGAYFRDLEQIIGALMTPLFFLSPIIYRPDQLSVGKYIIWLNPFSYFISLIRDPLTGMSPPTFIYLVTTIVLVIGSLFTCYQFGKHRTQIGYVI